MVIIMDRYLQSVVMASPINIPDGTYKGHWHKFAVYFQTPEGNYIGQYPCSSNGSVIEITVEVKNNRYKVISREIS